MPRQNPTLEDIALPNVQGARPVAGIDVSGFGRGGQALAQAGQKLGGDIEKSTQEIAATQIYQERNTALLTQDQILGGAIGLREKYKHDTGYGTLQDRYGTDLDNLVQQGLQNVPEGHFRDHIMARLQIPLARERASIEEQAFNGRRQNAHADLYDRANDLIQTTPAMDSDPLHTERMHSFDQIADEYASKGLITPLEKTQHTQRMLLGVADAEARKRGDLGPAEAAKVERELRESAYGRGTFGPTGSTGQRRGAVSFASAEVNDAISKAARATGLDEGMLRQFAKIESGGRPGPESDTGSYKGLLQLKQDEFQRNGGGDIYNPYDNAMAGAKKLKAESAAFTQQYGRAPTAADLYLIHNQGAGGYAAHMANPNAPAWQNMLSTAEGRQKGAAWAREAIWRNVPDQNKPGFGNVNNVTSRDFVNMWSQHVGGNATADLPPGELPPTNPQGSGGDNDAPSGFNPLFAKLTPAHRDALIAHMQTLQHKYRTDAHAQLQAGIKDDIAAASREGYVGQGRSREDFDAAYGDQGEELFADYNKQLQLAMDVHNMAGMSPEDRQALIESHRPEPGKGYATAAARQDVLIKENHAIQQVVNATTRDAERKALATFQERVKDQTAQGVRSGDLTNTISKDEFTANLGDEKGEEGWRTYTRNLQFGADARAMYGMSPEDRAAMIDNWKPQPNEPGYAEKAEFQDKLIHVNKQIEAANEESQKRADQAAEADQKLVAELHKDPSAYAIKYLPAVSETWGKLQDAMQPGQSAVDSAAAAQDFAMKTIAEQVRLGIAPQDISILPKDYVDNMIGQIEHPAQAGGPDRIVAAIKQQAELWGPAWPQVYRQMKGASPLVQVIGAGVKPAAAQILADNAAVKYGDIVKDEQSARAKEITENVDTEMAPFAKSLIGNAGGIKLYNDVRSQIEKLSAIYAFQNGMAAPEAAKKATEDVINFKYDFRDDFRIPAKEHSRPAGVPSDQVQLGAAVAKQHLGDSVGGIDLKVRPAIDSFGAAYTPAQLASETANAKKTGRWTTNNDESGLWFVYGGQVVRKPGGEPLSLTWQQLGDLGTRKTEDNRAMGRMTPGAPFRAATAAALEAERARNTALPSFHDETLEFPRHPNGQYRR